MLFAKYYEQVSMRCGDHAHAARPAALSPLGRRSWGGGMAHSILWRRKRHVFDKTGSISQSQWLVVIHPGGERGMYVWRGIEHIADPPANRKCNI